MKAHYIRVLSIRFIHYSFSFSQVRHRGSVQNANVYYYVSDNYDTSRVVLSSLPLRDFITI